MDKEEIVLMNSRLGIETIFSSDLETIGLAYGNIIYLKDNCDDLESLNKHEILHFFENTSVFKKIKKYILSSFDCDELSKRRKEYFFIYSNLYSDEEDMFDIIDNELVIDFIVENKDFIIDIDDIVGNCFDIIVNDNLTPITNKRYFNITLSRKIDQQFPCLTKWEKLFVLNYYNKGLPNGINKYEIIRGDIEKELNKLYLYADDINNFTIDYLNNDELTRELKGEIEALKTRGQFLEAKRQEDGFDLLLRKKAKDITLVHCEEYRHIVGYVRYSNYEDSFKYLILSETLNKIYKKVKIYNNDEIIIQKRKVHKSIASHMTVNELVLNTIYDNISDYNNFADLYFLGLKNYSSIISSKSIVEIGELNTFGKGKWLKFNSKFNDFDNYLDNCQRLSSLVQTTQWCTKQLAATHLEQGDFYVFIDNDNKPHIAIKMNGNEIDEVRGIKNDSAQELEDDYRDIAISFLKNNRHIKNGVEWLEKEEWNKRLLVWIRKIGNNDLKIEEIEDLLNDLFIFKDYKAHYNLNGNKKELIDRIKDSSIILNYLKEKFNCNDEDIYIGDIYVQTPPISFPYKVVLGDIYGNFKNICNMNNLRVLYGNCDCSKSLYVSLPNLEYIGGVANFIDSEIQNLINLKYIGSDAIFSYSSPCDMSNLKYIGGNAIFNDTLINLFSLEFIRGNAVFNKCFISELPSLKNIRGNIDLRLSRITSLPKLEFVGGNANFENSKLHDAVNLQIINGNLYCANSYLKELPSLVEIGKICTINEELKEYIKINFSYSSEKYTRNIKKTRKF